MVERKFVGVLRELVAKRVGSYAQFFMVLAYVFGALAGVFVTARWWGWALVTLVGLAVLLAAFEANRLWFKKQLKVLA